MSKHKIPVCYIGVSDFVWVISQIRIGLLVFVPLSSIFLFTSDIKVEPKLQGDTL